MSNSVTQRQVSLYCRYLVQYVGVKRQQIVRSREEIVLREQWYQQNKHAMRTMSLKDIQQNSYNTVKAA
ncbi:hypothetical protein [Acinetobacter sp. TUM15071]|uniref:hypothetical protein n=1 Tax=Acinetobacter sp. TUM15071 TaxID=2609135 RepID=UPI00124E9F57|nr:hypothetical protein [Acinetobacter sp. TUM15071]